MCSAVSSGCTPQHSFSLTSAAAPEVETQDLQCIGLAWFSSSFIYHEQAYAAVQPKSVFSGFTADRDIQFESVQPLDRR